MLHLKVKKVKNAPATTDDGFGGKNGVVDVKTLIN